MTIQDQKKPAANHVIEHIDADESGELSDIGDSIETDLTSLTSSIRNHVYENGRRYHALNQGTYLIPNDETEQERLDMMHHATGLFLDGELHAVKLPTKFDRVLDLGTGTGIWAIDFADMHPEATVLGVDLSPIQPGWIPPNCSFEVDDVEKPWLWKEPFDFIHSANIAQGIRDWPTYTKRIYDQLTPGGVVQLRESELLFKTDDDTIPKGGAIDTFVAKFTEAIGLAGLKNVCKDLEGYLLDAGFVDVRVVVKKLPIGPWPKDPKKKELGTWGLAITTDGLKSYSLGLFTKFLGTSPEEATQSCDAALAEFRQRKVHSYNAQYFVEGRKPTLAEVKA